MANLEFCQVSRKEEAIKAKLEELYRERTPFTVARGVSHTSRSTKKSSHECIDLSKLTEIIAFRTTPGSASTVIVEANVKMEDLIDRCLERDLLPPVVMECPKISVAGGFCGHSGESSSFRYGLFADNVKSIHGFFANARRFHLCAERDEDRDEFHALANGYGTVGIVTVLELQLRPALPFVKLCYHRITSVQQGLNRFDEAYIAMKDDLDYVDGVMFAKNEGVVVTGVLTTEHGLDDLPKCTFTKSCDPWYYLHLQEKLKLGHFGAELVPVRDYLFRYDRGSFWMGKAAFDYFKVPFCNTSRRVLDKFMRTHTCLKAFQVSKLTQRYFVQDLAVPFPQADAMMEWLDNCWGQYPVFLCPLTLSPGFFQHRKCHKDGVRLVNFGVYGKHPARKIDLQSFGMRAEAALRSLHGFKAQYAVNYCTEDSSFDWETFDHIRRKAGAQHLPTPHEKFVQTSREERPLVWPIAGLYGVAYVLLAKAFSMVHITG